MLRRASARLATKGGASKTSDQENNPQQLSSPPTTPAPRKGRAGTSKKATSEAAAPTIKELSQTSPAPAPPQSVSKPVLAAGEAAKGQGSNGNGKKGKGKTQPSSSKKRKRASPAFKAEEDDDDELPHNMGKRVSVKPKGDNEGTGKVRNAPRKTRAPTSAKKEEKSQDAEEVSEGAKESSKKKPKKANPYGLTPGETPFPDWPHPTNEECKIVHDLLMSTIEPDRRKRFIPPDDIPPPSEVVAGCGEVPSILDALIRTLLSAATSGRNSSSAFQGLVERFGLATAGVGKGSVNWNAVHEASFQDVFDAIKCGGLAKNKTENIQKLLAMVHTENKERLAALLKSEEKGLAEEADEEEKAERALELQTLQSGILTLDYYHRLEKDEALSTFTNYPGIGVKTATCVNLFCMQRPCFAVDTHVFRLCQYLGWVPPEDSRGEKQKKVDRNTTFSHCEVRVPDEYKYGLHQLFLEHGKNCPRCRAITGEKSEGWADANCVIEHLVKRLGAKKGGVDSPKKASKAKKGETDHVNGDEADDMDASGGEHVEETLKKQKPTSSKKAVTPKKNTKQVATATKTAKAAGKVTKAKQATKTAKPKTTTPRAAKKGAKGKKSQESDDAVDEDEEMSDLTDGVESSSAEEDEE